MAKEVNELFITPEAVALFPNLFEPKPVIINGQPQGDPIYGMSLLFEPEDVQDLKKLAVKLAQQRWPGRDLKTLQFPFTKGDTMAEKQDAKGRDGSIYRGYIVVKATSKYGPGVVGPDKKDILRQDEIYSGCIVRAQVNVKTYSAGSNEGVKCYLNHVMKTQDGERLIGSTAQDAFANIKGKTVEDDPTEGLDDEMPF